MNAMDLIDPRIEWAPGTYGHPEGWFEPPTTNHLGERSRCRECGETPHMVVDDYSAKGLDEIPTNPVLCSACGHKVWVVCKHCGVPVPAASNYEAVPWCLDCWIVLHNGNDPGFPLYKPTVLDRARQAVLREQWRKCLNPSWAIM